MWEFKKNELEKPVHDHGLELQDKAETRIRLIDDILAAHTLFLLI